MTFEELLPHLRKGRLGQDWIGRIWRISEGHFEMRQSLMSGAHEWLIPSAGAFEPAILGDWTLLPESPALLTREEVEGLASSTSLRIAIDTDMWEILKATALHWMMAHDQEEESRINASALLREARANRDRYKAERDAALDDAQKQCEAKMRLAGEADRYSKALDRIRESTHHNPSHVDCRICEILRQAGKL